LISLCSCSGDLGLDPFSILRVFMGSFDPSRICYGSIWIMLLLPPYKSFPIHHSSPIILPPNAMTLGTLLVIHKKKSELCFRSQVSLSLLSVFS
jgi:hypothetical protein